jgi:hypothetical protein
LKSQFFSALFTLKYLVRIKKISNEKYFIPKDLSSVLSVKQAIQNATRQIIKDSSLALINNRNNVKIKAINKMKPIIPELTKYSMY